MKFCRMNWKRLENDPRISFSQELNETDKLTHDAMSTMYLNGIDKTSLEEIWHCSEILKSLDAQFDEIFEKDPRVLMAEIEIEGVKMKGVVQDESTSTI